MKAPKIEICIEGYNIEQTDFYIAHILDKYNSLNELYKKSCEHIVYLEKECKDGFISALSESENRLFNKLESIECRLSNIETRLGINSDSSDSISEDNSNNSSSISDYNNRFISELSDFRADLDDIKSLFEK